MKVFKGIPAGSVKHPRMVLTIGVFDGMHLGHQRIMEKVVRAAQALKGTSAVLTFEGHPQDLVAPGYSPLLLATLEQKLDLMRGAGVDLVMLARFNRAFAAQAPERFVEDVLVRRLKVRELVVGHDFVFGRRGRGDTGLLKREALRHGFKLSVVGPVKKDALPVSSTRIRRAVMDGDMRLAARLLGRPYLVEGRVVRGQGRGRTLGFPTANLDTRQELLPKSGVWGGRARLKGGNWMPFIAALGKRPTFEKKGRTKLELHLLDFQGRLYGRVMEAEFQRFLRPERKFASVAALKGRIKKDEQSFRKWLGRRT